MRNYKVTSCDICMEQVTTFGDDRMKGRLQNNTRCDVHPIETICGLCATDMFVYGYQFDRTIFCERCRISLLHLGHPNPNAYKCSTCGKCPMGYPTREMKYDDGSFRCFQCQERGTPMMRFTEGVPMRRNRVRAEPERPYYINGTAYDAHGPKLDPVPERPAAYSEAEWAYFNADSSVGPNISPVLAAVSERAVIGSEAWLRAIKQLRDFPRGTANPLHIPREIPSPVGGSQAGRIMAHTLRMTAMPDTELRPVRYNWIDNPNPANADMPPASELLSNFHMPSEALKPIRYRWAGQVDDRDWPRCRYCAEEVVVADATHSGGHIFCDLTCYNNYLNECMNDD